MICTFQGLMFGYATDETEECMPLTVVLAHKLNEKIAELRRNGVFWWARPDTKTQVISKQIDKGIYVLYILLVLHVIQFCSLVFLKCKV